MPRQLLNHRIPAWQSEKVLIISHGPMPRLTPIFTLVVCLLIIRCSLYAQQQPSWEMEGLTDQSFLESTSDFSSGTGGVRIAYSGAVLTAEKVELDNRSGEALAEGKVFIQRNEQVWVGERIRYNFKTGLIQAEQFRTGKYPVFASGHGLHADITNGIYAATNAYITSDDIEKPEIKIRAKYIKIIPGEKIIAHGATLYLGEVPVFYFPYYSRNLGENANNFNFIPGYRTKFGPFLLSSYTWYLNEYLDGEYHVDYRQRRGIGTGPDFNYHLGAWGSGDFKYYYLYDQDPDAGEIPGFTAPHNRQRVYFSYQSTPLTNLEIKSVAG